MWRLIDRAHLEIAVRDRLPCGSRLMVLHSFRRLRLFMQVYVRVVSSRPVPERGRMRMIMGADNFNMDGWRSHVHNE